MDKIELCAPCLFGIEGLLANELRRLNMADVRAENGRVLFAGSPEDIARANINSRFAERVLVRLATFRAESFTELFDAVRALPLEDFIPKNGQFPVNGSSLNSQLHSIPDCQKIIKKAAADRLMSAYKTSWMEENGALYRLRFNIMKDEVSLYIDTSGEGLHKRGWRAEGNSAPIRETLAAAIVELARFRGKEEFLDPFCGSGTIAIEAALSARNRAPGIGRAFTAETWGVVPKRAWRDCRDEARAREFSGSYRIYGGDSDPKAIEIARSNAKKAGVDDIVKFGVKDALTIRTERPGGIIAANPPYGERMLEKSEAQRLMRAFGETYKTLDGWRAYIISSDQDFEAFFGLKAAKKRKLYNGMIKCDLYMFGV